MVLNKTILQSALNAFIIAVLSQFLASGSDLFALNGDSVKALLNSGVVAALWVVFRYINPTGSRFGYDKPTGETKAKSASSSEKSSPKKTAKKTPSKTAAKSTTRKKDSA